MKNPFDSPKGSVVAASLFLVVVLCVFLISLMVHLVTQVEHGEAILALAFTAVAAVRVLVYMFWEKD